MKKIIILALCLVMVFLVSCKQTGGQENSNPSIHHEVSSSRPTLNEYLSDFDTSAFDNSFTLTDAQAAVQKYRTLRQAYVGGPVEFLVALGFDREQIETGEYEITSDGNVFHKTKIYYLDLYMKTDEYVTQRWFEKEQVWLGSFSLDKNEGCFRRDRNENLMVLDATSPLRATYIVNSIKKGEGNTYVTNETIEYSDGTKKEITATVGLTKKGDNIVVAYWQETTSVEGNQVLPAPLS